MGRLITNPVKPVGRIKIPVTNYRKLLALANTVGAAMLTNIAIFPVPSPPLATMATDATALTTALAGLGTKTNRGGTLALNTVKSAAKVIANDLIMLLAYVQNIVDAATDPSLQASIIAASGFPAKSKKSKIPTMQFPTRIRQTNNKQFPFTLRRVNWKKNLGLYTGNRPKSYNIYAHTGAGDTILLTTTTKTNVIVPTFFPNNPALAIKSITIKPMTAAGEGNGQTIDVR